MPLIPLASEKTRSMGGGGGAPVRIEADMVALETAMMRQGCCQGLPPAARQAYCSPAALQRKAPLKFGVGICNADDLPPLLSVTCTRGMVFTRSFQSLLRTLQTTNVIGGGGGLPQLA